MSARRHSHDLAKETGHHIIGVGAMKSEGGDRHRVIQVTVNDDGKVIKS